MRINSYETLVSEYPELALFERHDAIFMAYLTGELDGRRNLLDRVALHAELTAKEFESK